MRELNSREVYRLEECLRELAAHHNEVSVNFKGCFPSKPFQDILADFEKDVNSGISRIAVIEREGKILGFCKADIRGEAGTVDYLMVRKENRGNGYGDTLFTWALDALRTGGARRIEIRVVDGNDAIRFYERYGFRTVSHILRMELPRS